MIYVRNCPSCNKELTTSNKYYYKKAVENNITCGSCALVGKPKTKEHIENMKKNHADFSGDKNPFFNKSHSLETKQKISSLKQEQYRSGEIGKIISEKLLLYYRDNKNPFLGKSHSKVTKDRMSEIKSERMRDPESRRKISESLRKYYSKNQNSRKGISSSQETKRKQRISAIKRLERTRFNGKNVMPNVNPREYEYFSKLEKKLGLDGIYFGKSNRQYYIEKLGYFPDFYDPINNVVIEYDEKDHYENPYENKLRKKDIIRQNEIIRELDCKFFRYNESIDLLYEITE